MATRKKTSEAPAFEDAMEELETVVHKLETGDVPLEESLAAFERGVSLVRGLHTRLDDVEKKIEELTRSEDGTAVATSLNEDD
ncbi:MAG: exodeoxyribonuclease VII small subunit [Hyphomicrobiaceae bacterium]|jgi:exodeoxyribonuclease VII small subunit